MEKRISVIIPAFNSAKYIIRCLESVLVQDFELYEVIVVDDASTDDTLHILMEYEEKYPDIIRILTQPHNHHQGAARNRGVKEAKGQYVLFLDSDDQLETETLTRVWDKTLQYDEDIVFFGYKLVDKKGNQQNYMHVTPCMVGDLTVQKKKALLTTSVVPWGKLIKRKLILDNQIYFPEDTSYEDQATTYLYYLYAKHTSVINDSLYLYNVTENSTTTSKNKTYHTQHFDMSKLLVDRIKERNFEQIFEDEIDYFLFEQMYILGMKSIIERNRMDNVKAYVDTLLLYLTSQCPDIKSNKYLVRYVSEKYKKIYETHMNQSENIVSFLASGYFNKYCSNYMLNLEYNEGKIRKIFSGKRMIIILWGAGEYTKNLVRLLRKIDTPIYGVVDRESRKIGINYEGYYIDSISSIDKEAFILVPYMGWIPDVIAELNENNKQNKIINFEALIKYDIDDPIEDYWEK